MIRFFVALNCAIVCASCSTSLPDLNIEEQWADAMRRQSLYALFPISEDAMVGDVLLDTRGAPNQSSDAFAVSRIARTDPDLIIRALCNDRDRRIFIASRPWPNEAEARNDRPENEALYHRCGSGGSRPGMIGHSDSNADIRLSRSDIPEATVARLTAGQLGASGFFGNFAGALGFGAASRVAMTIKLTDLESLELPANEIRQLFEDGTGRETATKPDVIINGLHQRWPRGAEELCRGNFAAVNPGARIAIVTRVEYANGIRYEFAQGSEQALRTVLDLSAVMSGQPQPSTGLTITASDNARVAISADAAQSVARGADAASQNLSAVETRAAARLSALLSGVTADRSNGVTGSLGIGTTGNLGLTATYLRPMAVGAGSRLVFPVEEALLITRSTRNPSERQTDLALALNACARVLRLATRVVARDGVDLCAGSVPGGLDRLSSFRTYICTRPS